MARLSVAIRVAGTSSLNVLGMGEVEGEAPPSGDTSEPLKLVTRDTTRLGLLQLVGQHELRTDVEAVTMSLSLGLLSQDRLPPLDCGGERKRFTIAQAVLKPADIAQRDVTALAGLWGDVVSLALS